MRPAAIVDLPRVRAADLEALRVFASHPELTEPEARNRLSDYLLSPEDPMAPSPTTNLSLRVDQGLVDQADALIPAIQRSPLAAFGAVKRSSVLRLALAEGLAVLAKRHAEGAPLVAVTDEVTR